jgi:competence protein ComEC
MWKSILREWGWIMKTSGKILVLLLTICCLLAGCGGGSGSSALALPAGTSSTSSGLGTGSSEPPAGKAGSNPGSAAAAPAPFKPGKLTIKLLDVGHGDCILLQGDGKTVLIDTGDAAANDTVLEKLRENKVTFIDALIITHYHGDHSGGLLTVLRNFGVGRIYDAGVVNDYSNFVKNMFQEYTEGRWTHTQLRRGQRLTIGDGYYFSVLSPGDQLLPKGKKEYGHYLNNNSLVLKLHYGKFQMLFTGDMEAAAEYQVMGNYPKADLHVDVLKVAHHGSRTSSTWDWLNTVKPTWGVISCGGDPVKFKHPDPKVLSTYNYLGIKVVTTKQNGDLLITTDGNGYDVHGSK